MIIDLKSFSTKRGSGQMTSSVSSPFYLTKESSYDYLFVSCLHKSLFVMFVGVILVTYEFVKLIWYLNY